MGAQIRSLEESLGIELLVRHSRGVAPTRAGQFLYKRAREILRLVDDTRRELADSASPRHAHIVLGLTNSIMNMVGREIVVNARTEIPELHVSLVEEMSVVLIDALKREEIDLAMAYDVVEQPGLLRVPLIEEELLLVTATLDAPEGDQVSFAVAVARPLVLATGRDFVRLQVTTTADRLGVPLHIAYDVSSVAVIKDLVASGGVATIMPMGAAIHDLQLGRLAARRIFNPTLKRTLYLVRRAGCPGSVPEDLLIDFLGGILLRFLTKVGPLAHQLPSLNRPLSQSLTELLGAASIRPA